MKKTGKILSAFLALVMAFALAVPAFADGLEEVSLADSGCSYTVAPIGTVRICLSDDEQEGYSEWEEYAVFDQAVSFTLKNGDEFYDILGVETSGIPARPSLNRDGSATLPADAEGLCKFAFESSKKGSCYFFGVCSKSYLDRIVDDKGLVYGEYKMEYIPNSNSNSTSPTQPSTPAVKPAPGKSQPIGDGSGEFWYTVKSGDSLSGIAAYYYGKTSVYKLILERNKGTIKNADALYAGQTIILPSYEAVSKGVATTQPSKPSTTTQPSTAARPSANVPVKPAAGVSVPLNDGSGEFAYTVKAGDSLSRIAAYYYGNANVYKLIYERNKDILKSASAIYAGQTIILPSYAAVAQGVAKL